MGFSASKQHTIDELSRLKLALDESAIVGITDRRGRITYANKHFLKISKYSEEELIGQDHRILNSGYHPKSFFKDMWSTIGRGEIWHGEVCNRAKDGSLYWVQTTIVPFLNEKGIPYEYISIRVDITDQKNVKSILHMAYHDELTGLQNRRMLKSVLPDKIKEARAKDEQLAVLFMDIDKFKSINDSFGHAVGDLFLKEVARRLLALPQENLEVFRINGDEFIITIAKVKNIERIRSVVTSILSSFKEKFIIKGFEFFINVSLGISSFPGDGSKSDEIIRHANRAMFSAKTLSGSTCVFFDKSMEIDTEEIMRLDMKLRDALDEEKLELHYQPKISSVTGKMAGMEALIRWFDDEDGFIPPNEFIPLAEDRGLISRLGDWTLREAARQINLWKNEIEIPFRIAVNISPIHFKEENFVEDLKNILEEYKVEAKYLEIEITENSMMEDTEEQISKLSDLQKLGIRIAIDDFGTGYSSLNYLKEFPIDTLKIDQSFIRGLKEKEENIALVSAIINLSHSLNLDVVAEGVEEESELEILKEHNCDYIQGYYYSRPLAASKFVKELTEYL